MQAVTWGHIVILAGLAIALLALRFWLAAVKMRGHGYGTPLYARGRTNRRSALYAVLLALALIALGALTPLWESNIA